LPKTFLMLNCFFSLLTALLSSTLLLSQDNYTPTYDELLSDYREMSLKHTGVCRLDSFGLTDRGVQLHALIINSKGDFHRDLTDDQAVVLIMNGIHPGEPCGINASLRFAQEELKSPDENVTYVIIPVFNTGGMMNRGSYSRANQVGPQSYGFRGNARNLDLNRDFVKADSRNTRAFYRLFHTWKPHIFIDTHTSNGADYQPTLTLLSTFPENLETPQGDYLTNTLEPALYESMKSKGEEMVPYVNIFRSTPDSGYKAFTDYPRYSTGFASLFNVIGFTTEAHMLKPFDERVDATWHFLNSIAEFANNHSTSLIDIKHQTDSLTMKKSETNYDWKILEKADSIYFPGFEANTKKISSVTGMPSLRYNNQAPYRKKIPYYKYHEAQAEYDVPNFYLISGAWPEIVDLLNLNNIEYRRIERDTLIEVNSVYIVQYESYDTPYEGHYKHYDIETDKRVQSMSFFPGDILVPTDQVGKKYLAHVFNPKTADSFFSWNFFDSCLMQKEYFSSYVFDETAAELLESDKALQNEFKERKKSDPEFAKNARAQLQFIYERSPYYEKSHRRLPVFELD